MVLISKHSSGGNENVQAISKSVAGRATKIHLAVDAHDNPITLILSDGTTHDIKVAPDLIDKVNLSATEALCADKEYDSDALRAHIKQAGCCDIFLVNKTLSPLITIRTGTYTR